MDNPFDPNRDPDEWAIWERTEESEAAPDAKSPVDVLRSMLLDSPGLDGLPTPSPVIADILMADSLAWLAGKPGHGKSFVALDMAGCIATGETWQGRPTKPGAVLYLIAEGATGLRDRVRAWETAYGHPMTGAKFLPAAVQTTNRPYWTGLAELVAEMKPTLIVIDTQARVTVGADENSAQDMGRFVDAVDRLRKASGACVLVVHHQGRNGEHMRGSTALDGAATTILRAEKDGDSITVSMSKQKDSPEIEPVKLRVVSMGNSAVLATADGTERPERVVERCSVWLAKWRELFAEEWVSLTNLLDANVVAKGTFHDNRLKLISAGAIERTGEARSTRYRVRGSGVGTESGSIEPPDSDRPNSVRPDSSGLNSDSGLNGVGDDDHV